VPSVCIRIPADLDLQSGAADPRRSSNAYHVKNGFNRFGFLANPHLALMVGQTVQTTGIKIDSQDRLSSPITDPYFRPRIRDRTTVVSIRMTQPVRVTAGAQMGGGRSQRT
jgi:hypothetical protein